MHCRYADGYDADVPYNLRVIDSAGVNHDGRQLATRRRRDIDFTGGTEVPRARIREVQMTLLGRAAGAAARRAVIGRRAVQGEASTSSTNGANIRPMSSATRPDPTPAPARG